MCVPIKGMPGQWFWDLAWRAYEKTAQSSPLSMRLIPRIQGGVRKPAFLAISMPMLLVQAPPPFKAPCFQPEQAVHSCPQSHEGGFSFPAVLLFEQWVWKRTINVQAKPEGLSVKVTFVCLGNVSSRRDKLVIVRSESVASERESPPVMGAGLQEVALGGSPPKFCGRVPCVLGSDQDLGLWVFKARSMWCSPSYLPLAPRGVTPPSCSPSPVGLDLPPLMELSPQFSSVQFSCSVLSDSWGPHEPQQARSPCASPTPGVYSNSCPMSRWWHPTISSSFITFSSCPQSFPASGSFPMSQLFTSGGLSIGLSASTSVLPMDTQDWYPLGWTGWISLQSKGLSRVFSNIPGQKHQFFDAQLSL